MESTDSARLRQTRRIFYRENSDDDIDYEPPSRSDRPSRSMRKPQSYREASDDSEPEQSEQSFSRPKPEVRRRPSTRTQDESELPRKKKKRRPVKRKYPTRIRTQESISAPFKKRKPNPANIVEPNKAIFFPVGASGKRPQWQTLPYEALVIIMEYASYPFYNDRSRETGSIEWLCKTGLLCRSFHDAATGAMLYSPPLYPLWRAQGLLNILQRDQNNKMRNRIKRLEIEVAGLLVGKNILELENLIACAPNLEHLRFYNSDDALARSSLSALMRKKKWSYPMQLFDKLDAMDIRLKSFEWNGRLQTPLEVLQTMSAAHAQPCFSAIESLTVMNIGFEDKYPEEDLATAQTLFSTSISALPTLASLTVTHCTILDGVTTPLLPPTLTSLEIVNNIAFLSDYLNPYLIDRGRQLISLSLKHNQSMSLDFLTYLASYTPRLQHLELDLSYFDPTSYNEVNPLFDDAMPEGPPQWPTSLVSIDIRELRQISLVEAEAFFQSLIDAAPELVSLKRLSIKAIIRDGSWRERAALRIKWISKLERVFLDTSLPRDVRSVPRPKVQQAAAAEDTSSDADLERPNTSRTRTGKDRGRRSGRIREAQISREAELERDTQSEREPQAVRGKGVDDREKADIEEDGGTGFIHGKCAVVAISMSDQRPAEFQFGEADFLDDEPDDDEDYRD